MSSVTSILIVEDEPDLRAVYELILKSKGFDVHTAENGKLGIEAVSKHKPSVVILDIFMPVMDGRDFLKNIDLDQYPEMVVIVCSNTSDSVLMQEVVALGAHKVVLKADMAPADLLALVEPYVS